MRGSINFHTFDEFLIPRKFFAATEVATLSLGETQLVLE